MKLPSYIFCSSALQFVTQSQEFVELTFAHVHK